MSDSGNFARLLLTVSSQLITVCGLCFIFVSVVFIANSVTGCMISALELLGSMGKVGAVLPSISVVFGFENFNRFLLIIGCLVGGLFLRKLGGWIGNKELIESIEDFTGKQRVPGERNQ
jgi:hypothetical protein